MKSYYVYMLRCFDGTFYIGVTNDLERRFNEHCYGINPECYTYNRRPLKLEFAGEFNSICDAIDFEKKMKRWSHRKKRAFAQGAWADLKQFSKGRERPERTARPSEIEARPSTPQR